jgi:hypothetical protein
MPLPENKLILLLERPPEIKRQLLLRRKKSLSERIFWQMIILHIC